MKGKACHPTTFPLPTVWVRIGLSPCLTAAVVLHEARHVWQMVTDVDLDDDERDAEGYMWAAVLKVGFGRDVVSKAFKEATK